MAGVKLRATKAARKALNADYSPNHLSELAAAIGTAELSAGEDRKARQLLRRSVNETNENALAQVEWCAQRTNQIIVEDMPTTVPRAFEAQARRADLEAKWEEAVGFAALWSIDQPFSAEARVFGSYCACEAEDWYRAIQFTTAGLIVDPHHPGLLNNQALALIEVGKLPDAVESLLRARAVSNDRHAMVRVATEALLLFRIGEIERGRGRYKMAIQIFERVRDRDRAAKAALMLAREEIRIGSVEAEAAFKNAKELANDSRDSSVRDLRERLERALKARGTANDPVIASSYPQTAWFAAPLIEALTELEVV